MFLADNLRSYETLHRYVVERLFGGGQRTLVFDNSFSFTGKADDNLNDGTITASERLGDFRIMLYNVLNTWGPSGDTPDIRQPLQEELLGAYLPDVLGTQEFSPYYHKDFKPILEEWGYASIPTPAGAKNYTELWYRTVRLDVVDSGWILFAGPNDGNSKGLTWAVFSDKQSGKKIGVMTIHWMYWAEGIDHPAVLASNAAETLQIVDTILKKHGDIPLVLGGDLNTNNSRASAVNSLNALKASELLNYAWDVAESKNDRNSCGEYAVYDSEAKTYVEWDVKENNSYIESFDHAFVSKKTVVKRFVTLASLYTYWSSDHHPLIIDIELK